MVPHLRQAFSLYSRSSFGLPINAIYYRGHSVATSSLGTNANNSIPNALQAPGSFITPAGVASSSIAAPADIATLNNLIRDDQNRAAALAGPMGGWSTQGMLYVPNRGFLKVLPGDWVGVDSRGWPILLSADTILNGLWTHTP